MHTHVIMGVSPATYAEVRTKLEEAGYQHAIGDDGALDMHGLALQLPAQEVAVDPKDYPTKGHPKDF